LLYPVSSKNYNTDPFIANEWLVLKRLLDKAYMLTIVGYSAPKADAAAVDLMSGTWTTNKSFELGQVNIVDVKPEGVLEKTWQPFFCRDHYGVYRDLQSTWIMRFSVEVVTHSQWQHYKMILGRIINSRSWALSRTYTRGLHR